MANQIKWQTVEFSIGDTIKVQQTVKEGDKTRIQNFQGIVIAIRGEGEGKNFIVRKLAAGAIGVEKIFPLNTPIITGVEVIKKGKVRRAKLYYLRDLVGKKATKIKDVFVKKGQAATVAAPISVESKKSETKDEGKEVSETKVKNAPKAQAPIKEKKVKKGPKKIVRKERKFVR